jgi:porphobilinogen synthase
MVRETRLNKSDFIQPLFIVPGTNIKKEISSLKNQYHLSVDNCLKEAEELLRLGLSTVLLFGLPSQKDEVGSSSWDSNGIIQQAVKALKKEFPELTVAVDVCFCEYTSHGHCGVLNGQCVDNDQTLANLNQQALSLAEAGADILAPSGMIDGMVTSIRTALDQEGYENKIIMSYAAKYASAFYGPFRDAVESTPSFGDRRTHQMDPANVEEALREVASDIEQGADIVMVKPALAYLDVISKVRDNFNIPIAAYNVSGEYAMIQYAAEKGLIDGPSAMMESLTSIKRAGAGIIITYFAKDAARLL